MTSKGSINKISSQVFKRRIFSALACIVVVFFLVSRFYNLPNRVGFDHDQEDAANTAWKIVVERKPILIGQETSVGGLFVGPTLYYLDAVAMAVTGMNPLSLFVLGIIASLGTMYLLFLSGKILFGKWVGLIASILYVFSVRVIIFDLYGNAIPYIDFVSALILLLSIVIFIKQKFSLLPVLALTLALSFHVHLIIGLLLPGLFFLSFINRRQIPLRIISLSALVFLLPFSTFVLFDIRHNFLIFKNLLSFVSSNPGLSNLLVKKQTLFTMISILTESSFPAIHSMLIYSLFFFATLIIFFKSNLNRKVKILITTNILAPLIILLIYRGHIPEYYFLPCLPFYILISAYSLSKIFQKQKAIFIALSAIMLSLTILEYSNLKIFGNGYSLKEKENAVNYVLEQTGQNSFNVYYNFLPGLDTGYRYIFKWNKRLPMENGKNLFIIEGKSFKADFLTKYKDSFPDKELQVKTYPNIQIIAIKNVNP